MQIQRYDEAKKMYTCKVKGDDKQGGLEVAHEDLTDQICVNVRVFTEQHQFSGSI